MNSDYGRSPMRGFTLIELLVAFTILSLLGLVAFSGLSISLSSWSRGNEAIDRLQEQVGFEFLAEQLRSALPFLTEHWSATPTIAFSGTRDSIQFVAGHSIADGPGSVPRWVRLSWQPGPENGRLTLNEHRILPPDQRPEAESHWSGELLRARTLEFRFLRTSPTEGFPEWIETWDPVQERGLPAAVAIISDHAGVDKLIVPLDSTQANRQDARLR